MATPWTLRARWIFPEDRPPIAKGTLTIAGERIVAVDTAGQRAWDSDLGNVALLPGLVNAHTHLDLGELRGKLARPKSFADWVRAVVAYRRTSSTASWGAAVRAGIDECLRSGTTLVGDIAAGGVSAALLRAGPLRSTVYYELIGLTKRRARQTWPEVQAWLSGFEASTICKRGLSPHAPYTVRRGLFRLAARASNRRRLPLAVHLGETLEEAELLATHGGALRALLEDLGAWDAAGLAPDLDWIMRVLEHREQATLIHANYLRPEGRHRVVYCPRTHAYFGHPPHPFQEFLNAGATVALGTDSLASNPDLSILEELRYFHRHRPEVAGATLLRMATLAGATVVGWGTETGSLTLGKFADFITIPIATCDTDDPHRLVLDSAQPVRDVWINGRAEVRSGQRVHEP